MHAMTNVQNEKKVIINLGGFNIHSYIVLVLLALE